LKDFMKRHWKLLLYLVCAVSILLAIYMCFRDTPEVKKIDLTFEAVKMDAKGKEIGTVQIHIVGKHQDYRTKEDVWNLSIDDFDRFTNIRMRKENNFVYFQEQQRGCVYFEAERTDRTYTETMRLYFADDFDRVVLQGRGEISYIGSGSGVYTAQECVSYFEENKEEWDYVESVNFDMTVDAARMDDKGYAIEMVQLDVCGYYRDYLFGKDVICLDIEPSKKNLSSLQAPESTPMYWNEVDKYNLTFVQTLVYGYNPDTQVSEPMMLATTDEFDRFIICWENMGLFYPGSVSGKYTPREIVEYFNSFVKTGVTLPEA